jgi:hypothetical protein
VIKKQIIYKTYKHHSVRVLHDPMDASKFDVRFTQSSYPTWSVWHKNADELLMKELVQIYSIRAWIFQWLPPRLVHWMVIGG